MLESYKGLLPKQQLLVSLFLKSNNKTTAANEAGYSSTNAFNQPAVQAAIAAEMSKRAERLQIGGDWVLTELKRVYDRCMQQELVEVVTGPTGGPEGIYRFNAAGALKSLELIGKHIDIRAFDPAQATSSSDAEIADRLDAARLRKARLHKARKIEHQPEPPTTFLDPSPAAEQPMTFLDAPESADEPLESGVNSQISI